MERLLGPVMQNGFLVADLDAAIGHWAHTIGVGPFFVFERVAFKECWYRGAPATDIDLTVAIAYWGEVQIELIHQRNAVPSIYTDFAARYGTGLQHMGVMSADLDADLARLQARGVRPEMHGTAPGMRFAYLASDFHPGGMIELIEATPRAVEFFARIRAAALDWDGRTAVMPR
jgi:hypothetical protein